MEGWTLKALTKRRRRGAIAARVAEGGRGEDKKEEGVFGCRGQAVGTSYVAKRERIGGSFLEVGGGRTGTTYYSRQGCQEKEEGTAFEMRLQYVLAASFRPTHTAQREERKRVGDNQTKPILFPHMHSYSLTCFTRLAWPPSLPLSCP